MESLGNLPYVIMRWSEEASPTTSGMWQLSWPLNGLALVVEWSVELPKWAWVFGERDYEFFDQ